MSIPNYVRPQLTIKQLLDRTPAATISRINAIVVGPQYLLNRYGKEDTPKSLFNANAHNISYNVKVGGVTNILDNEIVDLASVKVYAEGLEANLKTSVSGITVPSLLNTSILKSAVVVAGTGLDATNYDGRSMQVGDVLYITDTPEGVKRRRVVKGFLGQQTAASVGTNVAKNNNIVLPASSNAIAGTATFASISAPAGRTIAVTAATAFNTSANFTRGPRYQGKFGDRFTLTVITGGVPGVSRVRVTSDSGLFFSNSITSTDPSAGATHAFTGVELGSLAVNITGGALTEGMVFVFSIIGTYVLPSVSNITGTFTGAKDTTYLLRVVGSNTTTANATGAQIQISDTAGIESTVTVTVGANATAQALGNYGLLFAIDMTGKSFLLAGDTFFVNAKAAARSTTAFDGIILDGPAVNLAYYTNTATTLTVQHVLPFTGLVPTDSLDVNWTAGTGSIAIAAALTLEVTGKTTPTCTFLDATGYLIPSFRALVPPAYGESIIAIDTVEDITTSLGTISLDNDLAYAASTALAGSQGQRIYALRVGADSAVGFNEAFKKVESTDLTYAFAIISDKTEVKMAAKDHVIAMSQPEQKKFRRAYVGTDSPGEYVAVKYDNDGELLLATVSADSLGAFTVVTIDPEVSPGVNFGSVAFNLLPGDKVKIAGGSYTIASIESASVIKLTAGPVSGVGIGSPVEIWKGDTPASQVAFVAAASETLGTRRVANIWVEDGRQYVQEVGDATAVLRAIPARFVAAEIAGLRSAVLPQQGLTRTEVTSIAEAAAMHTRYTPALLDKAAAGGTYVITQDIESGVVFVRHQITTETDKGSLYYEDSVGVNLDNISFAVKDLLEGYIGKYNVNKTTLAEIRNKMFQLLTGFTQADEGTVIGPALLRFDQLVVEADAVFKDRVKVSARLFMPLPLNNAEATLQGSVDLTL